MRVLGAAEGRISEVKQKAADKARNKFPPKITLRNWILLFVLGATPISALPVIIMYFYDRKYSSTFRQGVRTTSLVARQHVIHTAENMIPHQFCRRIRVPGFEH